MWVRRKTRSENVKCCVWTICRSYEVWWISQTAKYHSDKLFRIWSSETRYFFSFDSRDIRYYFRFAEVSGSEWWRRMFQPSTAATVPQIRCDKISEYMNIEYKMIFTNAKLNKKQRQNISYFMKSHPSILEVSFNQMRNMFWRMFANFQFQLIFKRNCTVKTLFIEKCNIYLTRGVLKPLLHTATAKDVTMFAISSCRWVAAGWRAGPAAAPAASPWTPWTPPGSHPQTSGQSLPLFRTLISVFSINE